MPPSAEKVIAKAGFAAAEISGRTDSSLGTVQTAVVNYLHFVDGFNQWLSLKTENVNLLMCFRALT